MHADQGKCLFNQQILYLNRKFLSKITKPLLTVARACYLPTLIPHFLPQEDREVQQVLCLPYLLCYPEKIQTKTQYTIPRRYRHKTHSIFTHQ